MRKTFIIIALTVAGLCIIFPDASGLPALASRFASLSKAGAQRENGVNNFFEDDEDEITDRKINYSELMENPVDTAFRRFSSIAEIDWDEEKEEKVSSVAHDIVKLKQMKWPIRIGFFGRGMQPTTKSSRKHTGVDLLAPAGTNIHCVLDGVVEIVSSGNAPFSGYGKVILVNHSGKLWTLYSHNSVNLVKVGAKVKQDDVIAKVGHTGYASGNHVHFEVRNAKGTPLDPMKYLPEEGRLPHK